jgi:hypothetical protein
MKGLRKRPTYNELIEQAENSDDIIKKYPDRRATFMRNHPYLTTLDGENFMEALNMQQNNMIRSQQKDLLIRQYASQNDNMSHLETRASMTNSYLHKATQIPEYYNISDSDSSPPGSTQTYKTLSSRTWRSPPSHHSIITPTPMRNILIDPPLPEDHTGTAEDIIEEEKQRRLAERVAKNLAAKAEIQAMLKEIPRRRLNFEEEEEPNNTGSSSTSSGGVSTLVKSAGKVAGNVAGAVGSLNPGQLVGTIAGTTIGAAAIGAIETGSALYHAGSAAANVISNFYSGEGGEELPSIESSPEQAPKAKAKAKAKARTKDIIQSSPEEGHEPRGPRGRPRSESRRRSNLIPLTNDEDKPARRTRSGNKKY